MIGLKSKTMIYKSVSASSVLLKVVQDFGLGSNNWKDSGIEWIGEALEQIGNCSGMMPYYTTMQVKNHTAIIPCNIYELHMVEYNNSPLRMNNGKRKLNFNPLTNTSGVESTVFTYVNLEDGTTKESTTITATTFFSEEYYDLIPNMIKTSFSEGEISIYGIGFEIGEDGLPTVPDTFYHREACAFFILYKWLGRGNKHNTWDIKSSYDMFKGFLHKAQNKSKMPNIQKMEAFTNMWSRLVPSLNAPDSFFMNTQIRQNVHNV